MDGIFVFFDLLNQQQNAYVAYVAYIGLVVAVVGGRAAIFFVIEAQRAVIGLGAKPIRSLTELRGAKPSVVTRAAKEYLELCEAGMINADVRAIAQRHLNRLVPYPEIPGGLGLLLVGLGLALVFDAARAAFGLSAVAAFVLSVVLGGILDITRAKERFCDDICSWIWKNVGRFFAPDVNANLISLRNTMDDAIRKQSDTMGASLRESSETMAASMKQGISEMSRGMEFGMLKLQERLLADLASLGACAETFSRYREELEKNEPERLVRSYEASLEESISKLGEGMGERLAHTTRMLLADFEKSAADILYTNRELERTMTRLAEELGEERRNAVRVAAEIRDQVVQSLEHR